jgi:L,D-peptidoglycan transpeptidase YkuD (ErfK/YbiS/YcfS/YnhG family)
VSRRLGVLFTTTLLTLGLVVPGPAAASGRPLPTYLSLGPSVRQLVTVTSGRWSDTRASMRVWRKDAAGWHLERGPVRVRLGWNGWVRAADRRQSTGTTPAGRFTIRYVFGNRPDPGTLMQYRHVDRTDVWPYEPRDPATYDIYQPRRAGTSHWRAGYREVLHRFGYQYAYSIVLGFNLPTQVHWSRSRHQYVAGSPADVRRGGGIFLHVQRTRFTAGCVAGPIADVRWLVRRLDPALAPRIVMGPTGWVRRTL